MKKWSFLFTVVAFMLSFNAFATHGDNMIGFGAISKGMGGTGIGFPLGSESTLKNPAMLSYGRKMNEFQFAGTLFKPKVTTVNKKMEANMGGKTYESEADSFLIPAIGLQYIINEKMTFCLGAYGTSGLGVDYRKAALTDGLYKMATSLSIMKFVPSLAYQHKQFSFGASMALMYGALSIAYDRAYTVGNLQATFGGGAGPATGSNIDHEGSGVSQDLGFGFNLGLGYENTSKNFIAGLHYQSPIKMTYDMQINSAATDFGMSPAPADDLEQPAELGIGFSYRLNNWTVAIDFKQVYWESTAGYGDFGWEDQDVYGVGLQYSLADETFLRLGYSYGKNPLGDKALTTGTTTNDYNKHAFNIIGFPASVETHYTVGVTHRYSRVFAADFAFVYAPEYKATAIGHDGATTVDFENTHEQMSFTFALRWLMD